jgi:glutathione S-transferase
MLALYHTPGTRSSVVRWLLEEIGEPYEIRPVDLRSGAQRDPAFLAINPMGKVPVLDHDGAIVTETAAICCHLADAFPAAGLAPPIGDRRRGPYLRWMFFGPTCLEAAGIDRMQKREPGNPASLGYGDLERVIETVVRGLAPGPWLLGDAFTAADIVIGTGLRWGRAAGTIPDRPEIAGYLARLEARPALQRATAKDQAGG